ncbi:MAG: hypothetical protein KBT20_04300 [Bacteroidales bacterium]|nr:hypothetical protein [Candidatus Liminaster caballi]
MILIISALSVLFIFFVIFMIASTIEDKKREKRKEERRKAYNPEEAEKRKALAAQKLIEFEAKYGKDPIIVRTRLYDKLVVSKVNPIMQINETDFSFEDVLDYRLQDDYKVIASTIQTKTKTKTGSMVGRAIVGTLVAGPVGAVIGGATAKSETVTTGSPEKTVHHYNIYITVNDLEKPQRVLHFGEERNKANETLSLLKVVFAQKEKKNG